MQRSTPGISYARHASPLVSIPPAIAGSRFGLPLGLDELVATRRTPARAIDSPIALNGLRLHCQGAPASRGAVHRSAAEHLLASLAQGCCAPFRTRDGYTLELSEVRTAIATVGSPARTAAGRLVQYGYGQRYLKESGSGIAELDDDQLERSGEASTVVALAQQRGVSQVIGTLRFIVGAQLGIFDFFAPAAGIRWPHRSTAPAEYTRMAFHPVFDRMSSDAGELQRQLTRFYKLLVTRQLLSRCNAQILRKGVRVLYVIATPHVARFMAASGMRLEPLPGALAIESDFAASVRDAFPRYWRPEQAGQQPIPYIASTELDEVTVPIGQHRIAIAADNSLRFAPLDAASALHREVLPTT